MPQNNLNNTIIFLNNVIHQQYISEYIRELNHGKEIERHIDG